MIIINKLSWNLPEDEQQMNVEALKNITLYDARELILPDGHKDCWYNCAKVLSFQKDEILYGLFPEILEWFKDMNWPGCDIIVNRVFHIPQEIVKRAFYTAIRRAKENKDSEWEENLNDTFLRNNCPFLVKDPLWVSLNDK